MRKTINSYWNCIVLWVNLVLLDTRYHLECPHPRDTAQVLYFRSTSNRTCTVPTLKLQQTNRAMAIWSIQMISNGSQSQHEIQQTFSPLYLDVPSLGLWLSSVCYCSNRNSTCNVKRARICSKAKRVSEKMSNHGFQFRFECLGLSSFGHIFQAIASRITTWPKAETRITVSNRKSLK